MRVNTEFYKFRYYRFFGIWVWSYYKSKDSDYFQIWIRGLGPKACAAIARIGAKILHWAA